MTREDIDNVLGENEVTTRHISLAESANIMMYVPIHLELDRGSFDHYYRINVNELINSQMPVSDLDDLNNQGWAYDSNKENLIIYLTT